MNFTEIRLKIRHFFKKNKKIILIVLLIWGIIIFINEMLKRMPVEYEATTTYEPHVSIMNDSSKTPQRMQESINNKIEEYINACNDNNYQKAFNMLSDECKEFEFNNDITLFMEHVLTKMPIPKKYSIQNYSNVTLTKGTLYIYEVKYLDDILSTGLTNSQYGYTSEKISFYEDEEKNIEMLVGNYIYHSDVKSISENEYLKIDIVDKKVSYSTEEYEIKFTNRSEYVIVIADGYEKEEINLQLSNESRKELNSNSIVLNPGESIQINLIFSKFVDDGDTSTQINFGSIRVMDKYSGVEVDENIIKDELNNAIAKFSMSISVLE